MVDEKMLRGVVSMPSNIFANSGTNVSIVFLDASTEHNQALLMDASKLGEKKKIDGKNQRTFLSADEVERIVQTFNAGEEQESFSVLAGVDDIAAKNYSFSAGQYFEVKIEYTELTPVEFDAELASRMESLGNLFAEGVRLQGEIQEQLGRLHLG